MASNNLEAEANIKAGWITVTEKEFYHRPKNITPIEPVPVEHISSDLADQYEAKFGKRPHHRMNPETIEAALRDNAV